MADLSASQRQTVTPRTDSPAAARSARDRLEWMDAARGIGIVFVVMGHVGSGLRDAGIAQGPAWEWLDYSIYSFHMPLFFFLAGVNIPLSLRYGRSHFLLSKLWNVAYPYVLWSFVQGAALVEMSQFTNGHAKWSDLLAIGWSPMAQFWFLYALFVSQLAAMCLRSYARLTFAVVLAALLILQFPLPVTADRFIQGLAFTLIGMLTSEAVLQWRPRRPVPIGIGLVALFCLSIPVTGWLSGRNYYLVAAWPSTAAGVAAVLYLSHGQSARTAVWAALGRASMTIYVLHLFAAAGTRIVLQRLHLTASAEILFLAASTAGVAIPYAVYLILGRVNFLWPLGLAPLPRRLA